jgi:hypothetical protein
MQDESTLKVIRLTQMQACPKKLQKIVPKLFEQTTCKLQPILDGLNTKFRSVYTKV